MFSISTYSIKKVWKSNKISILSNTSITSLLFSFSFQLQSDLTQFFTVFSTKTFILFVFLIEVSFKTNSNMSAMTAKPSESDPGHLIFCYNLSIFSGRERTHFFNNLFVLDYEQRTNIFSAKYLIKDKLFKIYRSALLTGRAWKYTFLKNSSRKSKQKSVF